MQCFYPKELNLGNNYKGALIHGSFQLHPSIPVQQFEVSGTVDGIGMPTAKLLRMLRRDDTIASHAVWSFAINTETTGDMHISFLCTTELGTACLDIKVTIKDMIPKRRMLLCESPYNAFTDHYAIDNLRYVVTESGAQVNAVDELPQDIEGYDVVALIGPAALQQMSEKPVEKIREFVESGRRLVVFVDAFRAGSVVKANRIVEAFGITICDREVREVITGAADIKPRPIVNGIGKLRWFRACPIATRRPAEVVIRVPNSPHLGFLVCSEPDDNIVVAGMSELGLWVSSSWPFDNARLFANIMSASSAELRNEE